VSSPSERQSEARLIAALVSIRSGRVQQGLDAATAVLDALEQRKLMARAASGRLETAQALLAAGWKNPTASLAETALQFFEQRKIWESVWRGHAILFKVAANSADSESHRSAARSALEHLRASWSGGTVDVYLKRPDVAPLYIGLRF
jgi:hypothetical protein